jgi:hypothetical protein
MLSIVLKYRFVSEIKIDRGEIGNFKKTNSYTLYFSNLLVWKGHTTL